MGLASGDGKMKRLAWLAAIVLVAFPGLPRSASADTMVNFTYAVLTPTDGSETIASGILTLNLYSVTGATGEVDGSPITGATGSVSPRQFVDFTTSTGSATAAWNGAEEIFSIFNSAGTRTEVFGIGGFSFDPPLSSISPAPLPGSAPMFGMALLVLAAFGFASKRVKREPCSAALIVVG
jgi:hypothetical protein